jgi:hypothetical protein
MVILPNAVGEFMLYGYAERTDGGAWSSESVLETSGFAPDSLIRLIDDIAPFAPPAGDWCAE